MKRTIKLSESQLRSIIREAIDELDWKTYANAGNKRFDQLKDDSVEGTWNEKFDKAYGLEKAANRAFDDEYIGNMKYDTMGDKLKGKHSPRFDGRISLGHDRMAYGAINGYNKGGGKIFSTDKGVYHYNNGGLTTPARFFRDKEVADAYMKANDELWDYENGNYEYVKGKGWVKKEDALGEAISRILREMYSNGKDMGLEEYMKTKHQNWIQRGDSEEAWNDEGIVWAMQDYHSSMGEFSEADWAYIKKMGLEEIAAFCEEDEMGLGEGISRTKKITMGQLKNMISESITRILSEEQYMSDADIAAQYSGMKVINIKMKPTKDGDGWVGHVEVEFPNADDVDFDSYMVNNFIAYDVDGNRIAWDNWMPEDAAKYLEDNIRQQISTYRKSFGNNEQTNAIK